jgi:UDP-GlcNAc:undecaprenyl-phosphate/decaprenyl-phosphate GlcNAc-1-phosphate transferase
MQYTHKLYLMVLLGSWVLSFLSVKLIRRLVIKLGLFDRPESAVKTHKEATPLLGGVGIFVSFFVTLSLLRFFTHFPTGTLRNLRGIFIGGLIIALMGVIDDIKKPHGLGFKTKFLFQAVAAICLIVFGGIDIRFIHPQYVGTILTVLWVVGISNAFNIIDIMDGFSASQAMIAGLAFFAIALPSEFIYVNFTAIAIVGATLGFLPNNFSKKRKIFLGDSGSLFLGFVLAAISMGTKYDGINDIGVYAPLLILAIPIYDTFFVSVMRLKRKMSPFLGSKDHFALRLEALGFSRKKVVALCALMAGVNSLAAFAITRMSLSHALIFYAIILIILALFGIKISKVKMD